MSTQRLDPYDFAMREVAGVPIYYKNFPTAPCIHVRVVFRTGAFDDPKGKEGLAHFFEHLVFTGSPRIPDTKAVQEWKKKYTLNSWNAGTSFTYTNYWLRCLPSAYDEVLEGMTDMIFRSFFSEEDIERQRKIILQEAWGKFQNEKFLAHVKESAENAFPTHVHGRFSSPLGWPNTITEIKREDILSWHAKHYGIGNFFIVLSGAVDEHHVDAWASVLKDLPTAVPVDTDCGSVSKPVKNRIEKNAIDIGQEAEQVEIEIGRIMEPKGIDERYKHYMFSRLVRDILYERLRVEKALCYGVTVGASFFKSYGVSYMSMKTDEENLALVESEFQKVLKEIESGEHEERYNRLKTLFLEQILSSEELSSDIADSVFSSVNTYGKPVTNTDECESLSRVVFSDMRELAKSCFLPEFTFTEIIYPSKKNNPA